MAWQPSPEEVCKIEYIQPSKPFPRTRPSSESWPLGSQQGTSRLNLHWFHRTIRPIRGTWLERWRQASNRDQPRTSRCPRKRSTSSSLTWWSFDSTETWSQAPSTPDQAKLVDSMQARRTPLRQVMNSKRSGQFFMPAVSCKWTIRSDRAQNARSEALNLVRNTPKGRLLPRLPTVTGEPTAPAAHSPRSRLERATLTLRLSLCASPNLHGDRQRSWLRRVPKTCPTHHDSGQAAPRHLRPSPRSRDLGAAHDVSGRDRLAVAICDA